MYIEKGKDGGKRWGGEGESYVFELAKNGILVHKDFKIKL